MASLCITSKGIDCAGSIVQTVGINVSEPNVDDYKQNLLPRVKELIGFSHNPELIG